MSTETDQDRSIRPDQDRRIRPEVLKTESGKERFKDYTQAESVNLVRPLKTKPEAGETSVLFIFMKNVPSAESARSYALTCLLNPGKTAFLSMIMITAKVAASVQMNVLQMQLK